MMRINILFNILFIFILSLFSQQILAQTDKKSDKSALNDPITIQSDQLEYNHDTGIVTHTGHVTVKQNNKLLKANNLLIYNNASEGGLSKIIAKGSTQQLATFKLTEKKSLIEGQALRISYFPKTQILILEGDALLKKECDTFTSPIIQFDLASRSVTATKNANSRPTLVIYKNELSN